MGGPETHYGLQHGKLSQKEMFEWDVEVFLTRRWEHLVEYKENWGKYLSVNNPKDFSTAKATLHKVYRVYPRDVYNGYSLVAADSVEEANKFIEDFRKSDPHNECDSYGYSDVSEGDLEKDLFSTKLGIILNGIYYVG